MQDNPLLKAAGRFHGHIGPFLAVGLKMGQLANERLGRAPIEEVVITNTLPVPEEAAHLTNLTVLSIAEILAVALKAIFTDDSVSEIFMGENA